MRDWVDLILEIESEHDYWKEPEIVQDEDRFRPRNSDMEELLVGYERLNNETGWEQEVSWCEGIRRTIHWYANNKQDWYGCVDWR